MTSVKPGDNHLIIPLARALQNATLSHNTLQKIRKNYQSKKKKRLRGKLCFPRQPLAFCGGLRNDYTFKIKMASPTGVDEERCDEEREQGERNPIAK
ncbi:MAG: hypothetical protein E7058_02155 [Lentisphaerae bacterium]|nr:hypothetical protein [Lentisphaerota bacterium]